MTAEDTVNRAAQIIAEAIIAYHVSCHPEFWIDADHIAEETGISAGGEARKASHALFDSGLVIPVAPVDGEDELQEQIAAALYVHAARQLYDSPATWRSLPDSEADEWRSEAGAVMAAVRPEHCNWVRPLLAAERAEQIAQRALDRAEHAEADLAAVRQRLDQVRALCTPDDSVVTYGTRRPALYMSEVMAILDGVARGGRGAAPADETGGASDG